MIINLRIKKFKQEKGSLMWLHKKIVKNKQFELVSATQSKTFVRDKI